jgi:hypothetical protein
VIRVEKLEVQPGGQALVGQLVGIIASMSVGVGFTVLFPFV